MGKQIVVLLWSVIYGEVLGYVASALAGATFDPKMSAIISGIGGLVLINLLAVFIKDPKKNSSEGSKE